MIYRTAIALVLMTVPSAGASKPFHFRPTHTDETAGMSDEASYSTTSSSSDGEQQDQWYYPIPPSSYSPEERNLPIIPEEPGADYEIEKPPFLGLYDYPPAAPAPPRLKTHMSRRSSRIYPSDFAIDESEEENDGDFGAHRLDFVNFNEDAEDSESEDDNRFQFDPKHHFVPLTPPRRVESPDASESEEDQRFHPDYSFRSPGRLESPLPRQPDSVPNFARLSSPRRRPDPPGNYQFVQPILTEDHDQHRLDGFHGQHQLDGFDDWNDEETDLEMAKRLRREVRYKPHKHESVNHEDSLPWNRVLS